MKSLQRFFWLYTDLMRAMFPTILICGTLAIVLMYAITASATWAISNPARADKPAVQTQPVPGEVEPTKSVPITPKPSMPDKPNRPLARSEQPDTLRELHIMRKVFDRAYEGPYDNPRLLASIAADWPAWEDIYFDREKYRKRLEDEVAKDWSIGHWWWQASVTAACEDELWRGGPIRFTVNYPWIDFRDDLIFEVKRMVRSRDTAKTNVTMASGAYHTPRFNYPVAMLISLVLFAVKIAVLLAAALGAYRLWRVIVGIAARYLMPQDPDNIWVKRVASFGLGAALCVVVSFIMLFF